MIDKMVAIGLVSGKSATSIEALHLLLKRPWDPVLSTYNQQKPVSQVFTVLETSNHLHHYTLCQADHSLITIAPYTQQATQTIHNE